MVVFFCLSACLWAQSDTTEMVLGGGRFDDKRAVPVPMQVAASDGLYYNGVEITWQALGQGFEYWVDRSALPDFKESENVTERWIKSNTCYDKLGFYKPRYYYRVKAKYKDQISESSKSDIGFPKPIASGRDLTGGNTEQTTPAADLSAIKFSVLGLSHTERVLGEPFMISYAVENTKQTPLSKIELTFYLSENEQIDDKDMLLNTKMIDSIEGQSTIRDVVEVKATSVVVSGFIIMASGGSNYILTTKKSLSNEILTFFVNT
ncbi:MAG: hypothetical protein HC817_06485 [Saprospiraceae bacterium]|nr:hypothetical protein [Saprospiraceae bacterium]